MNVIFYNIIPPVTQQVTLGFSKGLFWSSKRIRNIYFQLRSFKKIDFDFSVGADISVRVFLKTLSKLVSLCVTY